MCAMSDKQHPRLQGLPSEQTLIQKSAPLLSLWRSPLTLSEFKILDAYLARIDSHHPEKRWVRFSKGELESILGIQKINAADLAKRIDHLAVMVEIDNPTITGGFDKVALFERAVCEQDADGIWNVDLCCTPSAMKYIFNIENLGYLRYKLQSIIHLSSRYSYLLFLYLERNRFRIEWDEGLEDLRNYLGCTGEVYMKYKVFNYSILKRCRQELEEKTHCKFSYKPIRRGKRVECVHFKVEPLSFPIQEEPTPKANDIQLAPAAEAELDILRQACLLPNGEPEFTMAEIQQINQVLTHVPSSKKPSISQKPNSVFSRQQYLAERYAAMNRLSETRAIRHRFNYLLKMIKQDAGLA